MTNYIDKSQQPILGNDPVDLETPQGAQWQASMWKFLLFSALGMALFIIPFQWDGKITILLGVLTDTLQAVLGGYVVYAALAIVTVSFVGALAVKVLKPNLPTDSMRAKLFDVDWFWLSARFLGALFVWMIYLQIGPEFIINRNTGGVIFEDLIPILIPLFFFAILSLPFLTDFGLMEFLGTLSSKVFVKLFRLPGRSAVDAMSSWFGAASIGLLVTMQEYDKSYYSQREAAIIATTFSVTSIAFTYVVAKTIGVDNNFVYFYLTIALTGFIAAIIMPRLPPLSLKPDTYHLGKSMLDEEIPAQYTTYQWALNRAITRAHSMPSLGNIFKHSLKNLFDIYFGLIPVVFAIGTIGLGLAEYTPVFNWLSAPLVPVLELLQIPEAAEAAPAMIMGFADMYLPALVGKSIESEMTRFIVGAASITQIIYMSEVGALILKSNIKLNVLELFMIFILRTLISLVVITTVAHLLY
ncbi:MULTISPECIES: YjiH family protein [unclassified Psychrobacter]|uniref:YjiH family protein n=1 Tax=unclassified Psychrobacter TaxID=196806 RepID=UPI00191B4295|nr:MULTISPECIES: YjiH family protein [unclassified Psychrobacter]|tara:strand:- start:6653 stop:8059 length:1407 start_codon:yes stop_codon:yes gene_type:complete